MTGMTGRVIPLISAVSLPMKALLLLPKVCRCEKPQMVNALPMQVLKRRFFPWYFNR